MDPLGVVSRLRHEGPGAATEADSLRSLDSRSRAEKWRLAATQINGAALKPGYYKAMLQRSNDSSVAKQVDKDIRRTFGSLQGVRVPTQEALQSLCNVLMACALHPLSLRPLVPPGEAMKAASRGGAPSTLRHAPLLSADAEHNPQVGYCQAMK
jgi:hypothetical protein